MTNTKITRSSTTKNQAANANITTKCPFGGNNVPRPTHSSYPPKPNN